MKNNDKKIRYMKVGDKEIREDNI